MRFIIPLLFLLILNNSIQAQNFEGSIEYRIKYTPKTNSIIEKDLIKSAGDFTKTYYKNGYYLDLCDSQFMSYQLFRYDKNAIFHKKRLDSDTLVKTNTIAKKNEKFKYKIYKKTDTILGYLCDKLIITSSDVKTTYYYSNKLSIDPKYYKNLTVLNKNKIVEIMKSCYLRFIHENEYFIADMIAVKVKREDLDDKIFEIPNYKYLKLK